MKEFMKNRAISTKNFVVRHKEAVIVGGIAMAIIITQKQALTMANEFIDEHGLTDEFIATM